MKVMGAGFSEFMFVHRIPSTAAAFSVGQASAEMARNMAMDMIIPFGSLILGTIVPINPASKRIKVRPFLDSAIAWIVVMATSYLLMEIVFARGVLGASSIVMDTKDRKQLEIAQKKASEPIQQAKQVVAKMVGGITGAPTTSGFAEVPASTPMDLQADTRRSTSTSTALAQSAPADFDGRVSM